MSRPVAASLAGAGLFAGAAAWALHQQAAYVVASWACGGAAPGIWISSAVALLILFIGAALSVMALRRAAGDATGRARPRRFLATVGVMAAALFLFAVALQAAAAFFLPGCAG